MDILAALDALDKEEKARNPTNKKQRRPQSRSSRRGSTRPTSLPPPRERQTRTHLTAPDSAKSDYAPSVRSESQGGGRRISFAEPARPSPASKRIWIATEKASLASGFPYDPRLQKYGIAEGIWERFNHEIIQEANVPHASWMWRLKRKEVIARLKNDVQYDGDFKRKLKTWNKVFKTKGFSIELALPGEHPEHLEGETDEDGVDRNRDVKKEAKKFRLIVSPNTEKGTSVYSRTSSLTRSITGEANLQQVAASQAAANQASENQADQDHHQESDEHGDP